MKSNALTRIYAACEKKTFPLLVCFQILVFVLILLFCNIKYEVSDDFIMEMILSGTYTGKNDIHIMFSNVMWASLLLPFYKIFPGISWYLIGQLSVCLLSYLAISYIISCNTKWYISLTLVPVLTAFTAMDLYILPQFTKTATVAILAGCLLFLWSIFRGGSKFQTIAGAALTLLGTWIRFKSLYIAAPFIAIVLFYETFHTWKNRNAKTAKRLIHAYLLGILLLAAIFGCQFFDSCMYSSDETYAFYKAYSSARSGIVDYTLPDYSSLASQLQQIGFSENDYNMICNWCFGDTEVFSLEQLQRLKEVLGEYRNTHSASFVSFIHYFRNRQLLYPGALLCIFMGLCCILCDWKKTWIPILSAGFVICFFYYFYWTNRNVYRVEFGYYFCAAVVIAFFCNCVQRKQHLPEKYLIPLFAVLLAFSRVNNYVPDPQYDQLDNAQYRSYVNDTFNYSWNYSSDKYTKAIISGTIRPDFLRTVREHSENLYVLDFNTTIQSLYYDFPPLRSAAAVFPSNLVYLGGVTVCHPSAICADYGVGTGNLLDLLTKPNVYFVSNGTAESILTYLHEHVDPAIQIELCESIDGYSVWKYTR